MRRQFGRDHSRMVQPVHLWRSSTVPVREVEWTRRHSSLLTKFLIGRPAHSIEYLDDGHSRHDMVYRMIHALALTPPVQDSEVPGRHHRQTLRGRGGSPSYHGRLWQHFTGMCWLANEQRPNQDCRCTNDLCETGVLYCVIRRTRRFCVPLACSSTPAFSRMFPGSCHVTSDPEAPQGASQRTGPRTQTHKFETAALLNGPLGQTGL
jgi:hypothetical protein